jgi:hypothetical protein
LRTCEASVSLTRHTNVPVLLLSCALWPLTTLSVLVRDSLHCSVKGVEHSVVQELQFIGNFSHGVAFISQNKNSLRYSTSLKKASFIASVIRTTGFSSANIIAKGFSNDQLSF